MSNKKVSVIDTWDAAAVIADIKKKGGLSLTLVSRFIRDTTDEADIAELRSAVNSVDPAFKPSEDFKVGDFVKFGRQVIRYGNVIGVNYRTLTIKVTQVVNGTGSRRDAVGLKWRVSRSFVSAAPRQTGAAVKPESKPKKMTKMEQATADVLLNDLDKKRTEARRALAANSGADIGALLDKIGELEDAYKTLTGVAAPPQKKKLPR